MLFTIPLPRPPPPFVFFVTRRKPVTRKSSKVLNLYVLLSAPNWVMVVCLLALAQVIIELKTPEDSAWRAAGFVVSVVFFTELGLRMYCTKVLKGNIKHFFRSMCNSVDFVVVLVDVVTLMLSFLLVIKNDDAAYATIARFGRAARFKSFLAIFKSSRTIRYIRAMFFVEADGLGEGSTEDQRAEVTAYRIPFENFAGFVRSTSS